MSVLSEGEGLFIMGWMGKEKKVAQRRRPSVNRRLVWALFFSHPRLLLPLLILYASASWWARPIDRSRTCTHTGRDARRQGAGVFSFLDASGTWRRLCAASFFFFLQENRRRRALGDILIRPFCFNLSFRKGGFERF